MRSERWDEIILLGDFMNCDSLSHWNENKKRTMENKRYIEECEQANEELTYIQACGKKVTYLEGNHENWVEQYIEHKPELEGELELPKKLELKKRKISWHPLNTLYPKGKAYFTHGSYTHKYHTSKHLYTFGCSIIYGHVHQAQSFQLNMKMQEPIMAWSIGCLCSHSPDYLKGRHANWIDGFGVLETNKKTGNFNFYNVNITDGRFIYQGKEWR
tara:strand:+ start:366 stop:1010 length:645 start_codon:yes stop_codon:yes gene_type:complete